MCRPPPPPPQVEYIRVTTFNSNTYEGVVNALKEAKVGRTSTWHAEQGTGTWHVALAGLDGTGRWAHEHVALPGGLHTACVSGFRS